MNDRLLEALEAWFQTNLTDMRMAPACIAAVDFVLNMQGTTTNADPVLMIQSRVASRTGAKPSSSVPAWSLSITASTVARFPKATLS